MSGEASSWAACAFCRAVAAWVYSVPQCRLNTTMSALATVARPYIQDSITGGKPALDAGIENLPKQRPFLKDTQALMVDLRPGVQALGETAPRGAALRTG